MNKYHDDGSEMIFRLKCGKDGDIDGLTSEHIFSHPIPTVFMSRFLPAINAVIWSPFKNQKTLERVIYCSYITILREILEYRFFDKFQALLATSGNQFGFRKDWGVLMLHAVVVMLGC